MNNDIRIKINFTLLKKFYLRISKQDLKDYRWENRYIPLRDKNFITKQYKSLKKLSI